MVLNKYIVNCEANILIWLFEILIWKKIYPKYMSSIYLLQSLIQVKFDNKHPKWGFNMFNNGFEPAKRED